MRELRTIRGAVVLAIALLGGCTSLPRDDDGALYAIQATEDVPFHAQGRFSARYEEKAFAARFDWRHAPDADEIEFISPLGTTVARLTRAGETITVQQGDDSQHTATNWEALTTQVFGFPLPVDDLAYWVRGVPAPEAATAVTRDDAGRLDHLRQQGWTVQYSYTAAAREPERLDIRYGETIGLRLKMDQLVLPGHEE
jgi:outer membrane lipoprotein LolB